MSAVEDAVSNSAATGILPQAATLLHQHRTEFPAGSREEALQRLEVSALAMLAGEPQSAPMPTTPGHDWLAKALSLAAGVMAAVAACRAEASDIASSGHQALVSLEASSERNYLDQFTEPADKRKAVMQLVCSYHVVIGARCLAQGQPAQAIPVFESASNAAYRASDLAMAESCNLLRMAAQMASLTLHPAPGPSPPPSPGSTPSSRP